MPVQRIQLTGDALRPYGRQIFRRIGWFVLGADVVLIGLVVAILRWYGPGQVPPVLVGGVLGEAYLLLDRERLRRRILKGDQSLASLSQAGPRLRQELLVAYRARATVLLTLPYHVAIVAYGVWAWPWRTVDNWALIAAGAFASFIAALGLANGVQFLYFSRLAGRIIASSN
jgi:hypothetical protein